MLSTKSHLNNRTIDVNKRIKTVWTVSTWVHHYTSVNINMTFQFTVCHKLYCTVRQWFCCCVHNVYVAALRWIAGNVCYTVNACRATVYVACVALWIPTVHKLRQVNSQHFHSQLFTVHNVHIALQCLCSFTLKSCTHSRTTLTVPLLNGFHSLATNVVKNINYTTLSVFVSTCIKYT